MRLAFWRSSSDATSRGLADAAQSALDSVRKQGGAMARLAERDGRPQFWIANSILRTVGTLGRRPDQTKQQALARKDIAGLTLSENMNALHAAGSAQPRYIELGLRAGELKKYLRWTKTVQ
jgi:hypothetical protein